MVHRSLSSSRFQIGVSGEAVPQNEIRGSRIEWRSGDRHRKVELLCTAWVFLICAPREGHGGLEECVSIFSDGFQVEIVGIEGTWSEWSYPTRLTALSANPESL